MFFVHQQDSSHLYNLYLLIQRLISKFSFDLAITKTVQVHTKSLCEIVILILVETRYMLASFINRITEGTNPFVLPCVCVCSRAKTTMAAQKITQIYTSLMPLQLTAYGSLNFLTNHLTPIQIHNSLVMQPSARSDGNALLCRLHKAQWNRIRNRFSRTL